MPSRKDVNFKILGVPEYFSTLINQIDFSNQALRENQIAQAIWTSLCNWDFFFGSLHERNTANLSESIDSLGSVWSTWQGDIYLKQSLK